MLSLSVQKHLRSILIGVEEILVGENAFETVALYREAFLAGSPKAVVVALLTETVKPAVEAFFSGSVKAVDEAFLAGSITAAQFGWLRC